MPANPVHMKTAAGKRLNIMRSNAKLGDVMHVNLPPPKSCDTRLPCYREGCYGMKFWNLRSNVRKSQEQNWDVCAGTPDEYFRLIKAALRKHKPAMFRWHSSGDIPNEEYLEGMFAIAEGMPEIRFMAMTKRYDWVCARRRRIPFNLAVVLSMWPGVEIPAKADKWFPLAWMRDPDNPDTRIPPSAQECDGGCDRCGACWLMKPGQSVVFDKH